MKNHFISFIRTNENNRELQMHQCITSNEDQGCGKYFLKVDLKIYHLRYHPNKK